MTNYIVEAENKEDLFYGRYTFSGELIRCKDCMYYYYGACMNTKGMITPEPSGFCSNAERRSDETN